MNTLKHTALMILLACSIFSAQGANPVWAKQLLQTPQVSVVNNKTYNPTFMAATSTPAAAAFDKCRKYKNKQIAGWVIFPVSLGALAGGGYLIYRGAKNISDATSIDLYTGVSTKVTKQDKTFLGVGAGLVFTGMVLFPTGLVMAIKGGTNYNRDCRGSTNPPRTMHFGPDRNGARFALKF